MKASSFLLRFVLSLGLIQPGFETIGMTAAASIAAFGALASGTPVSAQTSGSGGYSRPGGGTFGGSPRRPSTGGDRSVSRSYSGEAFREYQQQQRRAPVTRPGGVPGERRPSTYGWGIPYPAGQSEFGAWGMMFLLSLLNTLNTPGHTQFFRDNRDNPDYQAWRREADRMAEQDPALAQKLAELDRRLAGSGDGSRRPSAGATEAAGGSGIVILVIVVGGAAFVWLWFVRRRAEAKVGQSPPSLSGSTRTGFRVGMTFPFDPSPFLLAAGATKVKPPQGGGMVSIEAVGLVTDGSVALYRLYFPGRDAFLQLHLSGSGGPDECRYFNRIDEVTPSSQDEWGFWLDRTQGVIGWPQFQTKDGKLYNRIWAPGAGRIAPHQQIETIEDVASTRQHKLLSMLYGAPTEAAPPAPDTEYILVSAVEDSGQAWVEIHAGIDINPATLSLPSAPLSA